MRTGERAKVTALTRPTDEDREAWQDQVGLLVRRLNVPWTPDHGALWEVRFDSGEVVVFSEAELATVRGDEEIPSDMEGLREAWGDAPRKGSVPFRRLAAGSKGGAAILAVLALALAGVLLLWAGIVSGNVLLGVGGIALILVGIVSAVVSID